MHISVVDENLDNTYTPFLEVSTPNDPTLVCTIEGSWSGTKGIDIPIGEADTLIPAQVGDEVAYLGIALFYKPGVYTRRGSDAAATPWAFNVRRVS